MITCQNDKCCVSNFELDATNRKMTQPYRMMRHQQFQRVASRFRYLRGVYISLLLLHN
jgi:hypothetical protein